jgi:hypothetical protein
MTTFDRREEAFETKFAVDEELRFKAEARRNKLLGLWAASLFGAQAEGAAAYAREVVAADLDGTGGGAVRKVRADLEARGVAIPPSEFQVKLDALTAQAIAEVKAGK